MPLFKTSGWLVHVKERVKKERKKLLQVYSSNEPRESSHEDA